MELFDLTGKTVVLLGGSGVLGSAMAHALMSAGADVAFGDRRFANAVENCGCLAGYKGRAMPFEMDAKSRPSLEAARVRILEEFGKVDILVNAVGGNRPDATTNAGTDFFDLSADALAEVVNLNLMAGAVIPAQVFGKAIVRNPSGGAIVHVSSLNAMRPLTRVPGYSAAKAAVSNFTQWLAVDLARAHGDLIRVNAIAPGFFLTEQNRFLLTNPEDGTLSERGTSILHSTPMGRFGEPDDLAGTLVWLCSDASRFVTGIVVPVDGGFSAFSGV